MSNWLEGIEDRVVESYKAKNLRAKQRSFGVYSEECCALSALYGLDAGGWTEGWARKASASEDSIWSFIRGFDGASLDLKFDDRPHVLDRAAFDAGVRTLERVKAAGLL